MHHAPKRQLLGHPAALVQPAWKPTEDEHSSKILFSRLPADVGENEIEVRIPFIANLFKKVHRPRRNFSKKQSDL
jgi:hypothetical protein